MASCTARTVAQARYGRHGIDGRASTAARDREPDLAGHQEAADRRVTGTKALAMVRMSGATPSSLQAYVAGPARTAHHLGEDTVPVARSRGCAGYHPGVGGTQPNWRTGSQMKAATFCGPRRWIVVSSGSAARTI